ncbi:DUF4178 domain-containing protein [Micromonospora sp. WMMD1120]|uniref:DUF4178 domain-containing protein n=1 Tax=Micromonospora sp. WMMD1120 TaxID=3016106 RepID=UPI002417469B|nr:DUF4178 domain-containing protein [Micromonospora sp. WMMD1120]MDG4807062.1 DUF4178 domain-containing protein [Micromonospora sp. WMMD1120]
MDALVAVLAVLALVVLLTVVVRARRRAMVRPGGVPPATEVLRAGLRRLAPADRVRIREREYAVRATIRLVEGDWSWVQHLLDDDSGAQYRLSVEDGPELELVLWTPEPTATVTPGAPTIDSGGRRYTWVESGQARYTATGETELPPAGTMRYHDYEAGGGARLSFEAYGEDGWRIAGGDLLDPADVAIRVTPDAS